ncbi:MAG: PDZ domain-containing protein [Sporichthyaceae bacterium]
MKRNVMAAAVAAGLAAAALAGCSSDSAGSSGPGGVSAAPVASAAPASFDPAADLPAGYSVVSTSAMALGAPGTADFQVVVSKSDAVEGGTQNVTVYAQRAGQWRQLFDAADAAVPYEMQPDFGSPEGEDTPIPVLNQEHPIAGTTAALVRFAAGKPALVIYAEDRKESHIRGVLAVVDFAAGAADLDHYEMAQDLGAPTVIGAGDAQQLQVPNFWYPWLDEGNPVKYTQLVGLGEDGVEVLSDGRPYLGAWVSLGLGPGVMVSQVIAGTAAPALLQPGDRILSVNGNNPTQALGSELLRVAPGSDVVLTIERGGEMREVTVPVGDMSDAPSFFDAPEAASLGVEVAPLSGRPGIAVTEVLAGGPGAGIGLRPGDAIVRVGAFRMGGISDLDAALADQADREIEIEIQGADAAMRTVLITPVRSEDLDPPVALL